MQRIVCPDQDAWAQRAVQLFLEKTRDAIARRGCCRVALSGGSTPLPFFRSLIRSEARQRIDWQGIDFFWADERCVPPTDPASNYGVAWRTCLSLLPVASECVHRIETEYPHDEAARRYERTLRDQLGETPRLDLALLGVGSDGHTASLFPNSEALRETSRWVVPATAPIDPPCRVTMTVPMLNAARCVVFLVRGSEKREILRRLFAHESLPARRIAPTAGELIWLLDQESAP